MKSYPLSKLFLYSMFFAATGMGSYSFAEAGSASLPTLPQDPSFSARPMRVVSPRELMTFQERHELWLKMRATRSPAERMDLWAKKYAQLEKRATKLGVVLREPGPMMERGERYSGVREEGRWGPESREYGWQGGGHPSYGYNAPRYEGIQPRYEPFGQHPPVVGR